MKDFVSFGTDHQSMFYITTRLLKGNIDGFRVQKFQLAYILYTTYPSHKNLVKFCFDVHYMWWGNQEL